MLEDEDNPFSEVKVNEDGQDRVDRLIWRYTDVKTVREIAEMAGIKPDAVIRRKAELIDSVDSLTVMQKRQRALIELDGMARDARERAKNASDEFYAGMLNSSVSALKTMLTELNRADAKDSAAVDQLNDLRLKEIMRLIDAVVKISVKQIAKEYTLDEDALLEVFQENLVTAAQGMEE